MPLPETMNVIEIFAPGGPEVLVPASRPVPVPGPADVLIQVAAAGVNRPDVLQRAGHYPPPPGATDLPGLEVAGTVVARGDAVRDLALGDRVCALTPGGIYSASFGGSKVVFQVDANARPGATPVVGRLIRLN